MAPRQVQERDDGSRSSVSDDEILRLVGDERRRSVGFDNDAELIKDRERALDYRKGHMPDVKAPENRSRAVSTDVADAIHTILPDLVEIFTGGDDVAAFVPRGPQDEAAAQQETDYVNYVVFQDNPGWLNFYSFFDDALSQKTGLLTWDWEDEVEEEELKGVNLLAIQQLAQGAQIVGLAPSTETDDGAFGQLPGLFNPMALYDVTVRRTTGKLVMDTIAPEDFTIARDATIHLQATPYCAFRARPRAQDLLKRGVPRDIVDKLPAYGIPNDQISIARDTADESQLPGGGIDDMRQVEVHQHYIRVYDEAEDRMVLWRVQTDATEAVLIEREEVERIKIGAITPIIVTHRFYGQSIADLLTEIQKINTVLTRAHLDSVYFALNRRHEVSTDQANEFTISDLLRNEPGMPVRSRTGNAVRPMGEGPPGFDALASLEYFQTTAERRTGIVRAAQGLTPDTLHETAKGALAILNQAQKRVRMIARVFAETGVKDVFLGVHAELRQHATQKATVQLRGQWVDVDPTSWGERMHMTVEVGLGASGREQDLAALQALGPVLQQVIQMQGGPHGPIVTLQNAFNYIKRVVQKSGIKSPEQLVTDPSTMPPATPGGAPGAPPPAPNPLMVKAQGELQVAQMRAQADAQADLQEVQAQAAADRYKAQLEDQLKRDQMAQELQLKREQFAAELQLEREKVMMGPGLLGVQVHAGGAPG